MPICEFVQHKRKTSEGINVYTTSRTADAPEEDHMFERAVPDLVPEPCGALIMEGISTSMTIFLFLYVS